MSKVDSCTPTVSPTRSCRSPSSTTSSSGGGSTFSSPRTILKKQKKSPKNAKGDEVKDPTIWGGYSPGFGEINHNDIRLLRLYGYKELPVDHFIINMYEVLAAKSSLPPDKCGIQWFHVFHPPSTQKFLVRINQDMFNQDVSCRLFYGNSSSFDWSTFRSHLVKYGFKHYPNGYKKSYTYYWHDSFHPYLKFDELGTFASKADVIAGSSTQQPQLQAQLNPASIPLSPDPALFPHSPGTFNSDVPPDDYSSGNLGVIEHHLPDVAVDAMNSNDEDGDDSFYDFLDTS
jgi:hypothetical protein